MAGYVVALFISPSIVLMIRSYRTDLFYEKRYSHTQMVNPDFVALAKAMHCHAIRCDNLADLPAKMKEFMEYDNNKPILMDARIVKTEHVYPMVRLFPPLSILVNLTRCYE
jgi:thiamine pyrophosphate-dependent acetolactate synthase large subunit-like protein